MTIRRHHYVLAVHNIAASSAFYQRALGFQEVYNDGNWSFVKRDNCTIMLGECRDAIPPRDLGDHQYFAYLVVDDADAFYERCRSRSPAPSPTSLGTCASSASAPWTATASRSDASSRGSNDGPALHPDG